MMTFSPYLSSCRPVATVCIFVSSFALAPDLFGAEEKFEFPDASQHATVKQHVGLTDVEIDYSRPNKRDREIFGGLVPYGKVWRTGANASTKIKFSDTVKIGDKDVPAGEYAFYTLPNENEWTIILSKDTKLWGAYDYKADTDALRVTVKPTALANSVESFTIGFDNLKDDGATITLEWDKTRVPVELTTNTVEKVNQEIRTALKDPKALEPMFYYRAASFYYDHDKDLAQAAKWVDQAIEKQQPARYFLYYKKAQIEAKLGHKPEAKAAAEKSIELLKAGKNPDETAIRNSQLLIDGLR
jgi:tetratricopeptide (TPR) repeat protein